MATIELIRLADLLAPEEEEALNKAVEDAAGPAALASSDEDGHIVEGSLDDDVFSDFRDRLEANDLDADLYIPADYEDVLQVGKWRIASLFSLQLVLDSLREDFFIEDAKGTDFEMDDNEDDFERDIDETDEAAGYYSDEDGGIEMKDEQLRHVWRSMYKATLEAIEYNLPLSLRD